MPKNGTDSEPLKRKEYEKELASCKRSSASSRTG